MSHESAPGHGADSSPPHPPENTDEISDWVSGALHEVSEIQLEAQRPAKMTMVQTLVSDRDTARSLAELDRLIKDEADPVMRGQMQCQRAWLADRLYAERVAAEQEPAREAKPIRHRKRRRLVLAGVGAAVVITAGGLAIGLGAGRPGDADGVSATAGANGGGAHTVMNEDPYLEARAALDLNTTTPESVSSPINAGAAPMVYELTWAKELEGTVVEVGSIGVITLTQDRRLGDGGRVTIQDSEAVGAYTMGKEAGQMHITVRIAIRVPGPGGGEPQLIVLTMENREGTGLVGTGLPVAGPAPEPPWYVVGERT